MREIAKARQGCRLAAAGQSQPASGFGREWERCETSLRSQEAPRSARPLRGLASSLPFVR